MQMLTQLQFVLVFIFCIYIKLSFSPVADAGTSVLPPPAVQIASLHTNPMNNTALQCTQPEQNLGINKVASSLHSFPKILDTFFLNARTAPRGKLKFMVV